MELRNLTVSLGLNKASFDEGIQSVQGSLSSFGSSATSAGSALMPLSAAVAGLGAGALLAGTSFESGMSTIRIGTGATGDALKGLGESFETVLGQVPNAAGQVSTAIADLNTRLGLTGPALESLSTQFLNLSRITGTDVAANIRLGTRVLGDWSIENENAAGAMDFLWKVVQTTGITFGSLAGQIVFSGASLRQMGFDFETSAALIGSFEKAGVNTEVVLSSLRVGLSKMAKEGITDANAALVSLISEITNTESATDRVRLATELFGAKAGPDMAAAIGEGRFAIEDLLTSLGASEETINKAADDSKTFGDRWGEIRNQLTLAVEPIGTKLLNAFTGLMPYIEQAVVLLGDLVKWFTDLPAPVQIAIGILAGLVAAAGPVLIAVGALAASLSSVLAILPTLGGAVGGFAAVLNPVTLTIAAVAAGLTLAWNTSEPFRLSVIDLWNSIASFSSELITLAGNIYNLITGWEPLNTAVGWLFTKIGEVIGVIGSLAASLLAIPFKVLTDGLAAVNSLFGDTAKKVSDADAAVKQATTGVKDHAKETANLGEETGQLTDKEKKLIEEKKALQAQLVTLQARLNQATNSAKKQKEEFQKVTKVYKELSPEVAGLFEAMTNQKDAIDKSKAALVTFHAQFTYTQDGYKKLWEESDKLNESLGTQILKIDDLSKMTLPGFIAQTMNAKTPVDDLYNALDKMGIKSTSSFTTARDEAEKTYKTIMASDRATEFEKNSAYVKYLEAVKAESIATGAQLPKDFEKGMADAKAKLDGPDGLKKTKSSFETFRTEVSTIITNLSQDLSKSLFDGNLSWGEKLKGAFTSLAEAAVSMFVQPIMDAITGPEGLIFKALNPLIDKLTGIGGFFSGAAGGSQTAINGMSSSGGNLLNLGIPGMGSGGASTAAGAAGQAAGAGLSATMGIVTGAVQAVSAVMSNFQFYAMNKSLDLIETATRRVDIATTQNGEWNILLNTGYARTYLGYLVDDFRGPGDNVKTMLSDIKGNTYWSLQKHDSWDSTWTAMFQDTKDNTYWSLRKLEDMMGYVPSMDSHLANIEANTKDLEGGNVYNVTVNANMGGSSTPNDVADAIMTAIRTR